MTEKNKIIGREYLLFVSIILGLLVAWFSYVYIWSNFENPFSGSLNEFSDAVDKQPWQSSFFGNVLGNIGASFIYFFVIILEFPYIMVFLIFSFFTYKCLIKIVLFFRKPKKERKKFWEAIKDGIADLIGAFI